MQSVFSNGGVIGATLDYKSTVEYTDHASGTTTGYQEPIFVGGGTWTATSLVSNNTVTFPSLTGGVSSAPAQGDLVLVAFGFSSITDAALATTTAGWTELSEQYISDTEDAQLAVYYKIMGATPDTNITITSSQTDVGSSPAAIIQVWRNIDSTTPIDVTSVQTTGVNTLIPTFGSITPVTQNAIVLAIAVGAVSGTPSLYTSSLANFLTSTTNDTEDLTMGFGSYSGWTAGAYTPDSWGNGNDSTASSFAASTIALRPSFGTISLYNKKNSGLWNLESVFDAATISNPTVEYLVIAGGGGAGISGNDSGGGGAGGYRSSVAGESSGGGASAESPLVLTLGTPYTVTVGAGGTDGALGSNSVFASITSLGGGYGGQGSATFPAAGGSGGGAGNNASVTPGAGTTGQGYAGGVGGGDAAGGGGAGSAGNPSAVLGNGGLGVSSSITGTSVARAGGGAGGVDGGSPVAVAGGGAMATAGTVNTGGGGGGNPTSGNGGSGGSGLVVIRYPSVFSPTVSAGLTSTTTTVGSNKVTVFTAGTGTVTF